MASTSKTVKHSWLKETIHAIAVAGFRSVNYLYHVYMMEITDHI